MDKDEDTDDEEECRAAEQGWEFRRGKLSHAMEEIMPVLEEIIHTLTSESNNHTEFRSCFLVLRHLEIERVVQNF